MPDKPTAAWIGQPVPELPVAVVERAQQYYRDTFGFTIGWLEPDKSIGSVSRDKVVIFLRQRERPFEPAIHWLFAENIEAASQEMQAAGANIVDPLAMKPWGIRQFTSRTSTETSSTSTTARNFC